MSGSLHKSGIVGGTLKYDKHRVRIGSRFMRLRFYWDAGHDCVGNVSFMQIPSDWIVFIQKGFYTQRYSSREGGEVRENLYNHSLSSAA